MKRLTFILSFLLAGCSAPTKPMMPPVRTVQREVPLAPKYSSSQWRVPKAIAWREMSQETLDEANLSKKFMIIFFVSGDCDRCEELNLVFNNKDIRQLINDNFIPIKVQDNTHEVLKIISDDISYPTIILFTYDGNLSLRFAGVPNVAQLRSVLKMAIKTQIEYRVREKK